jgi:hypothetical protein
MSTGWVPSASPSRPWRRPMRTTGRRWLAATRSWRHRGRPGRLVRRCAVRRRRAPPERLPGITQLGALTLAGEVGDWRRFGRAAGFSGFCGLVPSESSSGSSTRRGHSTKCGNAHLRAQPAWVGLGLEAPSGGRVEVRERQQGLHPQVVARAWAAQLRLGGRLRRLAARKDSKNVVVTAIARELAGFLWAEMTA